MNRQIRVVSVIFTVLFIVLILNLSYITLVQGPSLAANAANTRAVEAELTTERGAIVTADGVILAKSEPAGERFKRVYPQGPLAAHIVGYSSEKYQKAGLEEAYNSYLLGAANASFIDELIAKFQKPSRKGDSLTLTIDSKLQELAERDLAGKTGAAVAIDPSTGAVLAMASSPGYDPGSIDSQWKAIKADAEAPLVDRATQGLYPPGSCFKIVTGAAALEEQLFDPSSRFEDTGELEVTGHTVTNYQDKAFGEVTFQEALELSINTVFAQIGLKLGAERLVAYADRFGFNETLDFELPVAVSRTKEAKAMDGPDVAATSFGQAKTVATPLEMALVTATIANDGGMMQPYLVQTITDPQGHVIRETGNRQIRQVVSAQTAQTVRNLMVGAVENGTAGVALISGVQVAGKTGTAETGVAGVTHSWFVAFAPADDPKVAVAVIVERGGRGGEAAGPIARDLIEQIVKGP